MRTQLRPALLINVGHAYLVVLALLLALLRHSLPWPDSEALRQWALVAVPLVVFAALVPAPPSKILVTASLAAAMDPVAIWLWRTTIPMPPAPQVALLVASPAIAALVSWAVSSATHQLSERIVKAREVGSYKLIERLGVGGMAEVWRARHRMLARPAAVKLIRPKVLLSHGPEESERLIRLFSKEAKATAALSSPHTIQIFDFGTTREGTFYYVMELLDGLDLQSLVELFGAQPAERVAHLLIQICNSLHEAHEANLVHRDVKPGNIFTCRYGIDLDFVKVLDFGLVMDRRPTPEELEDEKRFVGTPSVMAPEMMRHAAPVDARADIYALGCVAYWLLAGKRVFEAQTRNDMLVMHAHQRPLPPSRRGSVEVPPGLEALVLECLEKNPNRRPQSALELSDRIAELRLHLGWTRSRRNGWWLQHRPPRNLREVQR
jgi:serine/threonine-protein kinase